MRMKYAGTDGWMKAPNGKDTKLTEKQWLQVRTPSFKAWFGDWEGDPENASKAVDENGEPLVVYHGTNNNFDTFEAEMLGENTDSNASDEDFAKTAHIGFWVNTGKIGIYSIHKEVFINARNLHEFPSLRALAGEMSFYDTGEQFREEMSDYNDGVMLSNDEEFGGTSFAVFSPEQIKSATDNVGTFSENPDIRFSIREEVVDRAIESADKEVSAELAKGKESTKKQLEADREEYVRKKAGVRLADGEK